LPANSAAEVRESLPIAVRKSRVSFATSASPGGCAARPTQNIERQIRERISGSSKILSDCATLKSAMPNSGIQDTLRDRGVRLTRQRRILLDLIDHSGLHLDAESLYQLAKEKDPKMNRVTVYRSLKLFKEGGLVDELDLMHHSGDQHYYETRLKQEHAHVICLRCGKIEEYFGEPLQEMRRQVEEHLGFEVQMTRTEIGGYCSHCKTLRAQEKSTQEANA
jgi:Fur family transcriptional regulator, ferric uptake regulator